MTGRPPKEKVVFTAHFAQLTLSSKSFILWSGAYRLEMRGVNNP